MKGKALVWINNWSEDKKQKAVESDQFHKNVCWTFIRQKVSQLWGSAGKGGKEAVGTFASVAICGWHAFWRLWRFGSLISKRHRREPKIVQSWTSGLSQCRRCSAPVSACGFQTDAVSWEADWDVWAWQAGGRISGWADVASELRFWTRTCCWWFLQRGSGIVLHVRGLSHSLFCWK